MVKISILKLSAGIKYFYTREGVSDKVHIAEDSFVDFLRNVKILLISDWNENRIKLSSRLNNFYQNFGYKKQKLLINFELQLAAKFLCTPETRHFRHIPWKIFYRETRIIRALIVS